MKRPAPLTLLYAAAFALAAAALLLTARTVTQTPRSLAQLARRHGDLLQLQGLAKRNASDRAAVQALAASTNQPPELAPWLREKLPGVEIDVQSRATTPLLPGWTAHRFDVLLADVPLAEAGRVLAEAESLRPPWRTVEVQITAREGAGGRSRVALVLEGLLRKEGGAGS
jgi:hypothetical protein